MIRYEKQIRKTEGVEIRKDTYKLLNILDKIVLKYKGKIYLAKDNRVSKDTFQKMYKQEIKRFNRSDNFTSMQSDRIEI